MAIGEFRGLAAAGVFSITEIEAERKWKDHLLMRFVISFAKCIFGNRHSTPSFDHCSNPMPRKITSMQYNKRPKRRSRTFMSNLA